MQLEVALGGPKNWGGVSGNHRGRADSLARLMETQIWHPSAGSVQEGLSKGTVASASTSAWEKAALLLNPDTSVPLRISLVPFNCPVLELRASESV